MKITLNEKFLAYLALISGLSLSIVAEYYSILGLTAIFAAAVIPVVIMGVVLGLGKITATLWLKQNWNIAPWSIRVYLLSAIAVLMLITSMGIFGFLSKAHSDQSLISGDVLSKIAIYDEKIKTAKENIEADRKQLKQMDEAVDQVMGRSTDEKGADKANAIRKSQSRDRVALAKNIEANQKLIATLNDEAAPIRAEVRKVEAEVGPIKYIAQFVYGDTDQTILEKAVTWVIIILIVVFDPLAVILLLASQISFQNFRERAEMQEINWQERTDELLDIFEENKEEEKKEDDLFPTFEEITPKDPEPAPHHPDTHPYLRQGFKYPADYEKVGPMVYKPEPAPEPEPEPIEEKIDSLDKWNKMIEEAEEAIRQEIKPVVKELSSGDYVEVDGQRISKRALPAGYVQNEEQQESGKWQEINKAIQISEEEYLQKAREKQNDQNNTNNAS